MYVVKIDDVKNEIRNRFNSYKDFINDLEINEFNSIEDITTMVESFIIQPLTHSVDDHMEFFIVKENGKKPQFNNHLFNSRNV
jgi:hypothetical protein